MFRTGSIILRNAVEDRAAAYHTHTASGARPGYDGGWIVAVNAILTFLEKKGGALNVIPLASV